MRIELPLPLAGTTAAKLVLDVPGTTLNCAQCSKAFGVPLKQVRQDCLDGKLNATSERGGWQIPVKAAASLYLSEVISESAQVCADIAKSARTRK